MTQVALVTGASSGIGRATALALAHDGYRIALCARRTDRLEAVRQEICDEIGAETPVMIFSTDLRDESQILAMFRDIAAEWGGVDILINNAGLGHKTPLMAGNTDQWREMLEVNILALCICTREAIQQMQERNVAGHIVHVASMSGHRVPQGSGVYAATKFAVRALTEGLRQELREAKSPIRISQVSPGIVETEFMQVYLGDEEKAKATYASLEALQPDDIAQAIRYIVSQAPHVEIHDVLLRPTGQKS